MIPLLVVFAPCLAIAAWTYLRSELATLSPVPRVAGSAMWGLCLGSPISLFVWLPLVALVWGPVA